ncbi:MAG: hypothetical protein LDL41_04070 [Coleofasciculus sp. S288]|nr:hypothetical protein [Coleofasciculus sp. S288]
MKLDSRKPAVSTPQRLQAQNWSSLPDISPVEGEWQDATWVQLRERPTPYSHDEALLLCQHSDTEWVVWIPECGEMVLHHRHFGKRC